jgi:hypothetical protein
MLAFAMSLGFFVHFTVVGAAVVAALHTQRDLVRNLLIAPAVGIVATLVSTYLVNRLGAPVGSFAPWLAPTMLAAAIASLLWRRPHFPLRQALPHIAIAGLAFVATGWPLLQQGFAWLGKLNPDFPNYVLNAQRLVEQPWIQPLDPDVWAQQSDWAAYFVTYPVFGVRSGSELLLAWAIGLTRVHAEAVYMPMVVTLNVALIWAGTALISRRYRFARLLAGAMLASSAMLTLAVTVQLIAQILGLTLLALATVLCLGPFYRLAARSLLRFVALGGVVMAGFFLGYPETLPFFGLAFLIYHLLGVRSAWRYWGRGLAALAGIGAIGLGLIAPEVPGLLLFMIGQIASGTSTMQLAELFPYMLIPSAFAAVWGLSHYVAAFGADLTSAIAVGMALSLGAAVGAIWLALRREPTATVTVVMLALVPMLFAANSGFGMYKIAMYMQPFLLPTSVLALCLALRAAR